MRASVAALRVVLGDQLSPGISSLQGGDPATDWVLMMEVMEEATYVGHHVRKIAYLFSAMRHFAEELRAEGWRVRYVQLEDPDNSGSFSGEVARAAADLRPERIIASFPGEYRVAEAMRGWQEALGIPVEIREDDRFLCSREAFARWAQGRSSYRMEYFYREMRKATGLLMDVRGKPEGGEWNYDKLNREPLGPEDLLRPKPEPPLSVPPDATTQAVLDLVGRRFGHHFGSLEGFDLPVTRADARRAMAQFLDHGLALFGTYQDAMQTGEPVLYHSYLSLHLNAGLLDPMELCRAVEARWREGQVPLNAAEGFIRQILGWREYVRGIYWLRMPDYARANHLQAHRNLPDFYWTGATDMACMAAVVAQTRDLAYAHHIQRLMVAGNLALLLGAHPDQVNEWYLVVYFDAYEWVEMPNVTGMILFADGGLLGSKPYAGSGKYIDRMSDYCRGCAYDVGKTTGERACPYNFLYWDFLARHRQRLQKNPRMALMFKALDRRQDLEEIRAQAAAFMAEHCDTARGWAQIAGYPNDPA